jgi:ABC-type proline/glycine betaine transport system permease subunit
VAELVRWSWVEDNLDDIQEASIEHLQLVGASLAIAIAVSIPIAILVRRRRVPFIAVNTISGALYTIPSLAMFAFLLSFVGIGFEPAVIALAVSTVGIATIAVYIGAGGLGVLIVNDGIQRGLFVTPIVVGGVIATVMAIVIDLALVGVERLLTPWQRARAAVA